MTKCIKQQALEDIESEAIHTKLLIDSFEMDGMSLYWRIEAMQKAARHALDEAKRAEEETPLPMPKPAYDPGEWVWEDGERDWDGVTEWWVEDKKLAMKNSLRSTIAKVRRKRHLPLIVHAPTLLRAARRMVRAGFYTERVEQGLVQEEELEALRQLSRAVELATSRLGPDTEVPPMKPKAPDFPETRTEWARRDFLWPWEEREKQERKEAWDKYRRELAEWEAKYGKER